MNIINIISDTCPEIIGNFNTISGNVFFGKNVIIGNNCSIINKSSKQKIFIGDKGEKSLFFLHTLRLI